MDLEVTVYFRDRQALYEKLTNSELIEIFIQWYEEEYDEKVIDIDFVRIGL